MQVRDSFVLNQTVNRWMNHCSLSLSLSLYIRFSCLAGLGIGCDWMSAQLIQTAIYKEKRRKWWVQLEEKPENVANVVVIFTKCFLTIVIIQALLANPIKEWLAANIYMHTLTLNGKKYSITDTIKQISN